MRRVVLIVPELLGDPERESPLRQTLPAFRTLAELGEIRRLAPLPRLETPESLYLGAYRGEIALRPGPLIVSALGADPPERSIHFHLSLLSFDDGLAKDPGALPVPEDMEAILAAAKRLDTRSLTVLRGEARDHGLVLEGKGDLGTFPAAEVLQKPIRSHLPEGDHENALRRFIDDSINLLSELEVNQRRLDQGIPPINLLWPWGEGIRTSVPNLALRRGERATVESASFRLAGLARLTGDVHEERSRFGRGLQVRLRPLADRLLKRNLSIVVIDTPAELRVLGEAREEELHWFVRELDRELLQPLLDATLEDPMQLSLLTPGAKTDGLGLLAELPHRRGGRFPFDERTLEEPQAPRVDFDQAVREAL
ncbi:MAG: hypothetical protein ACO1SV_13780 [Fimbriimonas sp.]